MAGEQFSHYAPRWDHEQFFQICGSDKDLASDLISLYQQQFEESFKKLKTAVDSDDKPTAILYAHDIKGASGNLGCQSVSTHSRELEMMAKAGKLEEMKGKLDGLTEAQKEVMKILTEVLENFPEESESEYETDDDEDDSEEEE
mmetsp:Transcript_6447/g.9720  ORF Transcript_6447/g.9720 Transcript_6447/m.9720 type:complete len:144 (-) Transcript_6447:95-526(-)|eukprot:CAMPEP_0201507116 /NCGR_PEP_ID=MMETSP0161_2-20130828/886_1 /ASSEMBLY_ACC=CAM_ASM_000251 /TAXON_ID=180227 /ORGANISM="Neoparamoeba aestuarina, Strain SoJaBio B1-5/56/2" /LENGTH=143 /DNA_ID=CAMNT_0047901399 /DNA_START=42 /DNA_END=473 /DNA_ORIENTATION=-